MKLNLGCGNTKQEGYVNIDADPDVKPDQCLDFTKYRLPYDNGSVDEVTIFHTIEHIKRESHQMVICEINRVLKIGGLLMIAYPDAKRILENYLSNKHGMREYWEATILGRGRTVLDMHRTLIFTDDFLPFLREFGFGKLKVMEEAGQFHNTVIAAEKTFSPVEMTDLLRKELAL